MKTPQKNETGHETDHSNRAFMTSGFLIVDDVLAQAHHGGSQVLVAAK